MNKLVKFLKDYFPTAIVFLVMFLIYKIGADSHTFDPYLFPTTAEIKESFDTYLPKMFINLGYSLMILVPGLGFGTIIGLILGILLGTSGVIRKIFHPVIYFISVIPVILLSPFILRAAPTFRSASIILVLYNAIWPIMFATINGVMTVQRSYVDKADVLQIKGIRKIFQVLLPASMPSIASGFITAMRSSFLVLVYAEMYGTQYGMGYFVRWGSDMGLYEHVWSGFLYMATVLVIIMLITEKIKNYVIRWAL